MRKYIFPIFFYLFGSLILLLPIFVKLLFRLNNIFLDQLISIIQIKYSFISIILLLSVTIILITYDLLTTDEKMFRKNEKNIIMLLGNKHNIILNFVLCFFTGFFEELFFRGYLFILLSLFINNLFIIILIISSTFGILHLTQGLKGVVLSSIISIIFFLSVLISQTIWYAIIFHIIFNFLELTIIYPYQKLKFTIKE